MNEWIKKIVSVHTCFNCEKHITKKEIYSVDIDTVDGPLNLKLCPDCSGDFDDMLKELETNLELQKGTLGDSDYE